MFRYKSRLPVLLAAVAIAAGSLLLSGCRPPQVMAKQPSYEPLEPSEIFPDGGSARPIVDGTVPRSELLGESWYLTGKSGGVAVNAFPFPVTRQVMERGREQFNVYCSPCHAATGNGRGMIVLRGYKQPPSLHDPRLRQVAPGHFVDVMTQGFGVMPSYRVQVPPEDRWAIAAYIRALQLSQAATVADVPAEKVNELKTGGATR